MESIDKKLAENPTDKELKKKAKEFKKDILPRKQKYEEAFATFKGRNSYSKTDHFICRNDKRLIHVGDRKYVTECKNTDKNRTVPL